MIIHYVSGDLPPLTVYDKDSVKLVIHFAQNKPREDVHVMVISITSNKPQPIKSVIFQAAVPKVCYISACDQYNYMHMTRRVDTTCKYSERMKL